MKVIQILILSILVGFASASHQNPIRRVVTMMQAMSTKIEQEAKEEKKLHEQFLCQCKKGKEELQQAISDAKDKVPQLESSFKEAEALKGQLQTDNAHHQKDAEAAQSAMAEAHSLREKEAEQFAKDSTDQKATITALGKALVALTKGMVGGFLQTSAAETLRHLALSEELEDSDRELLTAFLSQRQEVSEDDDSDYAPQSGEIQGMLKQMIADMTKDLNKAIAAEESAKEDYHSLVRAKKKEVQALTKMIQDKTARLGEVGVKLVNFSEDLKDTEESLEKDQEFLADLTSECKVKNEEYEKRSKGRSEELVALSETVKLLNDDDALTLFKKTMPSNPTSFLQVQVSSKEVIKRARLALRPGLLNGDHRLDLISLALHGRKISFEKVINLIEDMITLLKKEQADDVEKKKRCKVDFDNADNKAHELKSDVSNLEKLIDDNKEQIATLSDELDALMQGIKDLDTQVAESTQQRKEEHAKYLEDVAANNKAKELLEMARKRLDRFYNPSFAQSFKKTALIQESKQDGNAVIRLIDTLNSDLSQQIKEAKMDEEDGQKEYEVFIKDSQAKRAADSKSITEKEGNKADLEAQLEKISKGRRGKLREVFTIGELVQELHGDCDELLKEFKARQDARQDELDSLFNAKGVLGGSEWAFIQTRSQKRLRSSGH